MIVFGESRVPLDIASQLSGHTGKVAHQMSPPFREWRARPGRPRLDVRAEVERVLPEFVSISVSEIQKDVRVECDATDIRRAVKALEKCGKAIRDAGKPRWRKQ